MFLFFNFDHLGVAKEFEGNCSGWVTLVWCKDLHEEVFNVLLTELEAALVGSGTDDILQAVERYNHFSDHASEQINGACRTVRGLGRDARHIGLVWNFLVVLSHVEDGDGWLPLIERGWLEDLLEHNLFDLVDSKLLSQVGPVGLSFFGFALGLLCLLNGC